MGNTKYYGRKISIKSSTGKREVFMDINKDLRTTKQFSKYIYELTFKEATESKPDNYWGWKNSGEEDYRLIHPLKSGIEICFPSGTKAEEERGRGKLVELVLESEIQIE